MTAHLKKVLVGIVGSIVLLIGVALLVLPGPAFLVIPAGLAILATEFAWARRWKDRCTHWVHEQREKHKEKKRRKEQAYST